VIDVGHEKIAVDEARRLSIPIIGVVDTNNKLDKINYVIPGNDDSIRAIRLYCSLVADAILASRANLQEAEQIEEEIKTKDQGRGKKATARKVVTRQAEIEKKVSVTENPISVDVDVEDEQSVETVDMSDEEESSTDDHAVKKVLKNKDKAIRTTAKTRVVTKPSSKKND